MEERSFTHLYAESGRPYLMDLEKCEQFEVPTELFGEAAQYLKVSSCQSGGLDPFADLSVFVVTKISRNQIVMGVKNSAIIQVVESWIRLQLKIFNVEVKVKAALNSQSKTWWLSMTR